MIQNYKVAVLGSQDRNSSDSNVAAWSPTLGPAVTSGTAEFAHQLGDATDRAAAVDQENRR